MPPLHSRTATIWAARHFVSRHRAEILTGIAVATLAVGLLVPVALLTAPNALADSLEWLGPMLADAHGRSAATIRAGAVADLAVLLRASGIVLAVLAGMALAGIGMARAVRQSAELSIHRAVGASRRTMARAALLEALSSTLLAALVATIAGLGLLALARATWPGTIAITRSPGWLTAGMILVPLVAIGGGAMLPLIAIRQRRVTPNTGPPLELHVAGGLLGVGAAAVATAVLFTPVAVPSRLTSAEVAHATLPQTDLIGRLTALYDHVRVTGHGVAIASAGTEAGLGRVELEVTDCGRCSRGGMPTRFLTLSVVSYSVSPDTFAAIGARVVEGRDLRRTDAATGEPVVVINRALAREYFEAAGALGRRLKVGDGDPTWYRVVGIVEDTPASAFGASLLPAPHAYFSLWQRPMDHLSIMAPGGLPASFGQRPLPGAARLIDRQLLSEFDRQERSRLVWARAAMLALGSAATLVAIAAVWLLVAVWLRGEHLAVGVQRSVGAPRWRIVVGLVGRLAQVGAIATAVAVTVASTFRAQLSRFAPGSASWRLDHLAIVLGAAIVIVGLGAWRPSRALVRWAPARLLAD